MPITILKNASADALAGITSDSYPWYGGQGDLYVWGNFGGGVIYLEHTPDNGATWFLYDYSYIFEPTMIRFNLIHGTHIRIRLANNQQAASGIYARVFS